MVSGSSSLIPSNEDIERLHKKYAPNDELFSLVYGHCKIVWDIANQLIENRHLSVDREVVRVGCLLHDIGVYRLWDKEAGIDWKNYIAHGILGDELLKNEPSISPVFAHIASHHTGVGLTSQDVIDDALPLPPGDYLAETPEERLVMYADKFHSKTTPPSFNSVAWYAEHVATFGKEKAELFMGMVDEFGEPDLEKLSKKYGYIVR